MKGFSDRIGFFSGDELRTHLRDLIENATEADIATAWLTHSITLKLLVSHGNRLTIRIVAGVGNYGTDPSALHWLKDQNVAFKIHGGVSGTLFHPKLYIFRNQHRCRVLVGSMNLTQAGTTQNVESLFSSDMKQDVSSAEFNRFSGSPSAVPFAQFDLKTYEQERRKQFLAVREAGAQDVLDAEVLKSAESRVGVDVLRADWDRFIGDLRKISELDQWRKVMKDRHLLIDRNWSRDLDDTERRLMFGSRPYEHFGDTKALKMAMSRFTGEEGKQTRQQIGAELRRLREAIQIPRPILEGVVHQLLKIDFCGPALTTRLLVLTRPDLFVVVNEKSFEGLRRRFSLNFTIQKFDAASYMGLLDAVHREKWYRSSRPEEALEQEIWDARAAYIDPLVYQE